MDRDLVTQDVPENELLRGVREGDEGLFEQLVARYNRLVLSTALRLTRNRAEADDVAQEVFWCIHRRIATYDPSRPFVPWLYKVTLNLAYTHLRQRAARTEFSIEEMQLQMSRGDLPVPEELAVAPDLEERLARQEMARRAKEIIAELPQEYGAVLRMHDVEGISAARVSEVLDLSLPAVKSRLYRGRLVVRRLLLEWLCQRS